MVTRTRLLRLHGTDSCMLLLRVGHPGARVCTHGKLKICWMYTFQNLTRDCSGRMNTSLGLIIVKCICNFRVSDADFDDNGWERKYEVKSKQRPTHVDLEVTLTFCFEWYFDLLRTRVPLLDYWFMFMHALIALWLVGKKNWIYRIVYREIIEFLRQLSLFLHHWIYQCSLLARESIFSHFSISCRNFFRIFRYVYMPVWGWMLSVEAGFDRWRYKS